MKPATESAHQPSFETYSFSKSKLPKTLSYPLKRSLLDSALCSASVYDAVYSVRYLGNQNCDVVLDVMFVPEGRGHVTVSGRCLITVWAVPAERRHATEQAILAEGLPVLCQWLVRAKNEGNAWRGGEHSLTFQFNESKLRHTEN